jgi:hypothetical protein
MEKILLKNNFIILQGWLKGVNSNILDPEKDMGNDGDSIPIYVFLHFKFFKIESK